jgi:hypothetical protein
MSDRDTLVGLIEQWSQRLSFLIESAQRMEEAFLKCSNDLEQVVLSNDLDLLEEEMEELMTKLNTIHTMIAVEPTESNPPQEYGHTTIEGSTTDTGREATDCRDPRVEDGTEQCGGRVTPSVSACDS